MKKAKKKVLNLPCIIVAAAFVLGGIIPLMATPANREPLILGYIGEAEYVLQPGYIGDAEYVLLPGDIGNMESMPVPPGPSPLDDGVEIGPDGRLIFDPEVYYARGPIQLELPCIAHLGLRWATEDDLPTTHPDYPAVYVDPQLIADMQARRAAGLNAMPIPEHRINSAVDTDAVQDIQNNDAGLHAVCTNAAFTSLRKNLFFGEGDLVPRDIDGDAMQWYFTVFGFGIVNISSCFMRNIGNEAFDGWLQQFAGIGFEPDATRNRREADLLSFIEDFDLTKQDIIRALEQRYGKPMYKIDAQVNRVRAGYEMQHVTSWASSYSLSDIEALFSNNVSMLWAAFPGLGIYHNGRAYSPEWVLNNMERAIVEEQLPFSEIERILYRASCNPLLDELRHAAEATLLALR